MELDTMMMTDSERVCFTFLWRIENFPYCSQKKGERLDSPSFIADTIDQTEWRLSLYPRGLTDENYIGHSLQYLRGPASVMVDFEICYIGLGNAVRLTNKKMVAQRESGYASFAHRDSVIKPGHARIAKEFVLTVRLRVWRRDKMFSEYGVCHACTRIAVERKSFFWTIDGFSTLQMDDSRGIQVRFDTKLLSTKFFVTGGTICERRLQLETRRLYNNRRTFCYSEVSIMDWQGNAGAIVDSEYWFSAGVVGRQVWYSPPLIAKADLVSKKDTYLRNDGLILRMCYVVSDGVQFSRIEETQYGRRVAYRQ